MGMLEKKSKKKFLNNLKLMQNSNVVKYFKGKQ